MFVYKYKNTTRMGRRVIESGVIVEGPFVFRSFSIHSCHADSATWWQNL
jgi:hypothetical protein